MTSAINGMSVAEVRKYLGETRKKWKDQTQESPMYPTDCLTNNMPLQEFSLKFELGHHKKRHNKGKRRGKGPEKNDSDDEDLAESFSDENSPADLSSDSETSPEILPQQSPPSPPHPPQLTSSKPRTRLSADPSKPTTTSAQNRLRRSRRIKLPSKNNKSCPQTLMDFAR